MRVVSCVVLLVAAACAAESSSELGEEKASFYTPLGFDTDLSATLLKPLHRYIPLVSYDDNGEPKYPNRDVDARCPMPRIDDEVSYLHREDWGLPAQRAGAQDDTTGPYALKWSWTVPKPLRSQFDVRTVVAVAISSCSRGQLRSLNSKNLFPRGRRGKAEAYLSTGSYIFRRGEAASPRRSEFDYDIPLDAVAGGIVAIVPKADGLPQVPGFFCGDTTRRDFSREKEKQTVVVAVQSICGRRGKVSVRSVLNQKVIPLSKLTRSKGWADKEPQRAEVSRKQCFGRWGLPNFCE